MGELDEDDNDIDFDIKFSVLNSPGSYYHGSGLGTYSVWPTSVYEFTLYYQFVPVVPVS